MNKNNFLRWKSLLATLSLVYLPLFLFKRPLINRISDSFIKRIMTEPYTENLWEFISAATRSGLQTIVETNLRSEEGKVILRPLGSPRKFPHTDNLVFNSAQLNTLPTEINVPVDTTVVLGPQAKKPVTISMPVIISGIGYAVGLSENAKIALAKATSLVNTAFTNGEGPFLTSERKAAKHYILQYDRGQRNRDPQILRQADMIEIQFGQGALAGVGRTVKYQDLPPKGRKLLHLKPGQECITNSRVPEVQNPPLDLPPLITKLRQITNGIPIGAKIAAGNELEKDLEILINAGVDFISIDGTQAGSKEGPPILQDDFGLPTVFAVKRTAAYLEKRGVKNKITLIVGGGLFSPGEFLKILALGANAIYIGTIALYAMSHKQVLKALPWEPPTQVVFANSKYANKFNIQNGALNLAKFLQSCNQEIQTGIRALGKTSLSEVNRSDLAALDPVTAQNLNLPLASQEQY